MAQSKNFLFETVTHVVCCVEFLPVRLFWSV